MNIPIYGQRDPRWARQRLGTVNNTTLGSHGCLITCIAMMDSAFDPKNPWNPSQVDNWFTEKGGYANGNLVIWSKIQSLLPNSQWLGMNQTFSTPADVQKIKRHLDSGGLCILQVGFGGDVNKMHFVLAVGYNGNDIIFHDPWYGDKSSFASRRYGNGSSARDIYVTHYFRDALPYAQPVAPTPPKPAPVPVPAEPRPDLPPEAPAPKNEATPPPKPEPETKKPPVVEPEPQVKEEKKMSNYNKFLVALSGVAGVLAVAAKDGVVTGEEFVGLLVALASAVGVFFVRNGKN